MPFSILTVRTLEDSEERFVLPPLIPATELDLPDEEGPLDPEMAPRPNGPILKTPQAQSKSPTSKDPTKSKSVPLEDPARKTDFPEPFSDDEEPDTHVTRFAATWIPAAGDHFGWTQFDWQTISRFPDHGRGNFQLPLNFSWIFLNGPTRTDLPAQLYVLSLVPQYFYTHDENWAFECSLAPSWYTDFSNKSKTAFRLPGHFVSYYSPSLEWTFALGAQYLDRDDIHVLPILGVIYDNPDQGTRVEAIFPKPKISQRVSKNEFGGSSLYLSGELGGGSWAVHRADGDFDVVTVRDLRVMLGLETHASRRQVTRWEAGWVFDRAVTYRTGSQNYNPGDALILRYVSDY